VRVTACTTTAASSPSAENDTAPTSGATAGIPTRTAPNAASSPTFHVSPSAAVTSHSGSAARPSARADCSTSDSSIA
jgi:hypothetical protein